MATLTRAVAEALLVDLYGKPLLRVGKDGATRDGTNADLGPPIAAALQAMGLAVSSPTSPSDADLAAVLDLQQAEWLARAGVAVLERVVAWFDEVDEKAILAEQKLSQYAGRLAEHLAALKAEVLLKYGVAATPAIFGPMTSAADPGAGGLIPCAPAILRDAPRAGADALPPPALPGWWYPPIG